MIRVFAAIAILSQLCWATEFQRTEDGVASASASRIVPPQVKVQRLHFPPQQSRVEVRHVGLDETPCENVYAPLDGVTTQEVALDSGLMLGFYVTNSVCPECVLGEPFRIEALNMRVRRPDGSAADTLEILVSVYCPADRLNPCAGTETVRTVQNIQIGFEADSVDGNDDVRVISPQLFTSVDDGGAIVVFESVGMMNGGATPFLGLSDSSTVSPSNCTVWIGRGLLEPWPGEIGTPAPGGPQVSVEFSCGLTDTVSVIPCTDLCPFGKFSGEPIYFDPFTTVAYQWVNAGDVEYPVRLEYIHFTLFFEQLGQADDTAYVRIVAACPMFSGACCPPGDVLMQIPVTIPRGTPFQTVLDISVGLDSAIPVISGPFWFGAVIDSVSGQSALPSFLFSSSSQTPGPAECEQWCGIPGQLTSERSDDLGWADLSFSAVCRTLTGGHSTPCAVSATNLDCAGAPQLLCSERGELAAGLQIPSGSGVTDRYCCSDLQYSGRKLVFRLAVPEQTNLSIELYEEVIDPLTLFLLSSCDQQSCVATAQGNLTVTGLAGQDYFLVVESGDTLGHEFDLFVRCYGDCIGEECIVDFRGAAGVGNRYLDGEGNGAGDTLFYSYYPGVGTEQTILRFASDCSPLSPVHWQSHEPSASRMLAYDPRNGGEYWCGTTIDYFAGSGRLYRISSGGGVVQEWNFLAGLPIMRWSGAAIDAVHNHLWVMIRDSLNLGDSRAYELDISNPQQPVVIQGPHVLTQESPNLAVSSGGADYADSTGRLLVMFQGLPDDFVQCYEDSDPAYSGPAPGPGLIATDWCVPDSNSVQGYGLACQEAAGGGEIAMMNFTDADWQHPLMRYPAPCRLTPFRCIPPEDLTIVVNGGGIELRWTAIEAGVYEIYSSLEPDNDGNPNGGQDSLFHMEVTLSLPSGQAQWTDTDLSSTYKSYSIVLNCPSGVGQNSQFGQLRESERRKEENGNAD